MPSDEKDMRRMVHTFTMNGFNFAVDGNSGSIHVLDDISCQLLSGMQELIPLNDIVEASNKYSYEEIRNTMK